MSTTFGRTDKIDIFNLVATFLSCEPITDAEFASPSLKLTKSIVSVFRIARNALLREHDWKFAKVVTELIDAPTEVTLPGWDYFYYYPNHDNLPASGNKPQGSINLRKVFIDTDSQEPDPVEYEMFNFIDPDNSIDGVFIATQHDDCYAEYTNYGFDDDALTTYGGVKSVNYDPIFSEALAYKIAAMICNKITGSAKLADRLSKAYEDRLGKAKQYNKGETHKEPDAKLKTCDYIDARG